MLVSPDLEWCLTNIRKQRRIYCEGWARKIPSISVASEQSARHLEIQKEKKKNLDKENQPFHPHCIQHPWVSGSKVTDIALQVL